MEVMLVMGKRSIVLSPPRDPRKAPPFSPRVCRGSAQPSALLRSLFWHLGPNMKRVLKWSENYI